MYLAALGLGLTGLFVQRVREPALRGIEALVDASAEGWLARVDEGEALLSDGRYLEAAVFLEDLDARFPARTNIHALDKDRERILAALGQANEALGRKGRALDAYRRAVAFDPRNVENHYALAVAAIRLGEEDEAARHLDLLLDIYPPHQRGVRERIALDTERGDFPAVRRAFERYVQSFRVEAIEITIGEHTAEAMVPVDGEPHVLRFGLPPVGQGPSVLEVVRSEGVDLAEVRWVGRVRAGVDGRDSGVAEPASANRFELPEPAPAELFITASAAIPLDADTWRRVETAYRNLLASEELERWAPRLEIGEGAQ